MRILITGITVLALGLIGSTVAAQSGSTNYRLVAGTSVATGGDAVSGSGATLTSSMPATTSGQSSSANHALEGGVLAVAYATAVPPPCCLMPGDANDNGVVDIIDFYYLRDYLHKGSQEPLCFEQGDVNGDGVIDQADIKCLVRFVFSEGNPCILAPCP